MKRLAILSIFDSAGIIDRYLWYYAKSLSEVADELVITVNGTVRDEDFFQLKKLTHKILIRENKGYDAGAYKDAIAFVGRECFRQYDEVILSNDTNFGPFLPFQDIFESMECKPADFWGLNYEDRGLFGYVDAYFLVFRKKTIATLFDFFSTFQPNEMDKAQIVHEFEIGLFQEMIRKKYQYAIYTNCNNLDLYSVPNLAVKNHKLPLMKKRCFEKGKYIEDNCLDCLRYIKANYDYDIHLILETVNRKYGIIYQEDDLCERELNVREIFFPMTKLSRDDLISLSEKGKKMYIYGTGCFGKTLYRLLSHEIHFEGFIVSDEYYSEATMLGKNVYKCSDINPDEVIIIVAVKEADGIKEKFDRQENIYYLW